MVCSRYLTLVNSFELCPVVHIRATVKWDVIRSPSKQLTLPNNRSFAQIRGFADPAVCFDGRLRLLKPRAMDHKPLRFTRKQFLKQTPNRFRCSVCSAELAQLSWRSAEVQRYLGYDCVTSEISLVVFWGRYNATYGV